MSYLNPFDLEATVETVRAVERIDISSFCMRSMKPTITVEDGVVVLRVATNVNDRNTGKPIEVVFQRAFDPQTFVHMKGSDVAQYILHDYFMEILRHELDECFMVGGKRVRDPHANGIGKQHD